MSAPALSSEPRSLWLSRAFLNPLSRAVRADLADPGCIHRTLMSSVRDGAGPAARAAHGLLYRIDVEPRGGRIALLMQGLARPDWSRFPEGYFLDLRDDFTGPQEAENPVTVTLDPERLRLRSGERLVFRLRANTTRKIETRSTNGERSNGRRVPLRGDDARIAWLRSRAARAGFRVECVRVTEVQPTRSRVRPLTLAGSVFDGVLTVMEPASLWAALTRGMGPGKAFGFGLLSLRPAPEQET